MVSRFKIHKISLTTCLIFGQLLSAQVTWAQLARPVSKKHSRNAVVVADPYSENEAPQVYTENMTVKKNKFVDPEETKPILFDLPAGSEFQIKLDTGYLSMSSKLTSSQLGSLLAQAKSSSDATGMGAKLEANYGITDNFYTGVALNYSSITNNLSTDTGSSSFNTVNSKSSNKSDGIREPEFLLGSQILLNSTRLFAELIVDIPIGDKVTKPSSGLDTTDNNLNGGMSYSPRLGVIQDLGSVDLFSGISYTIQSERIEKTDYSTYSTTRKTTGGNNLDLIVGSEFKKLSRLGFVAGYSKYDSTKTNIDQSLQSSENSAYGTLTAASYLGIKLGSSTYIIPKLTYTTVIEKSTYTSSSGSKTNLDQMDSWTLSLGARVGF